MSSEIGRRPNVLLSLIVWLMPNSRFKIALLRRLGNHIGENCRVGINLVMNCGQFDLGDYADIWSWNVFRNLGHVSMAPRSFIGSWNQFTAALQYQSFSPHVGALLMREHSAITNRHYFDCSGQIILRPNAGIGGIKSVFQSHEIDLRNNETTLGRIIIGENSMTGTGVLVLKDAVLPDKSILAAGSILVKAKDDATPQAGLYGGVPARYLAPVDGLTWWDRATNHTPVTDFDDSVFRLEGRQHTSGSA